MSVRVTRTVPGRTCTVIGMKRRVLVPVRVTCWTAPEACWLAAAAPDPVRDTADPQPATAMAVTTAPAARNRLIRIDFSSLSAAWLAGAIRSVPGSGSWPGEPGVDHVLDIDISSTHVDRRRTTFTA